MVSPNFGNFNYLWWGLLGILNQIQVIYFKLKEIWLEFSVFPYSEEEPTAKCYKEYIWTELLIKLQVII